MQYLYSTTIIDAGTPFTLLLGRLSGLGRITEWSPAFFSSLAGIKSILSAHPSLRFRCKSHLCSFRLQKKSPAVRATSVYISARPPTFETYFKRDTKLHQSNLERSTMRKSLININHRMSNKNTLQNRSILSQNLQVKIALFFVQWPPKKVNRLLRNMSLCFMEDQVDGVSDFTRELLPALESLFNVIDCAEDVWRETDLSKIYEYQDKGN